MTTNGAINMLGNSKLDDKGRLPTKQIDVREIFVEYFHDIFPEHLVRVPYEIPENIPK